MKKKANHSKDLAALHALGALGGDEARAFADQLATSAELRSDARAFDTVAEALAQSLPAPPLSPCLKEKVLHAAELARGRARTEEHLKTLLPAAEHGLAFLKNAIGAGWQPLPVPGASVKLLSFDETAAYAVVLGKLEPGARYPSHGHQCSEDIYMLSGDLHIGDVVIQAGDYHHAEGGSQHPANWSETGCVLLCILSKDDLLAQLAAS